MRCARSKNRECLHSACRWGGCGQSYGNTWIQVWADSPETDGYVYRKVLTALQSYRLKH